MKDKRRWSYLEKSRVQFFTGEKKNKKNSQPPFLEADFILFHSLWEHPQQIIVNSVLKVKENNKVVVKESRGKFYLSGKESETDINI